jgi:hypothetical protein
LGVSLEVDVSVPDGERAARHVVAGTEVAGRPRGDDVAQAARGAFRQPASRSAGTTTAKV